MNASPVRVDLIEVNASWTAFFHLWGSIIDDCLCGYAMPMNSESTVEVMDTADCV